MTTQELRDRVLIHLRAFVDDATAHGSPHRRGLNRVDHDGVAWVDFGPVATLKAYFDDDAVLLRMTPSPITARSWRHVLETRLPVRLVNDQLTPVTGSFGVQSAMRAAAQDLLRRLSDPERGHSQAGSSPTR